MTAIVAGRKPRDEAYRPTFRSIGRTVRSFRLERKWSLEDLADRAGLSVTAVAQIERAERWMTVQTLLQLARAFEVVPSKLLDAGAER